MEDIIIQIIAYVGLAGVYAFIEWRKNQNRYSSPASLVKSVEKSEDIRNLLEYLKSKYLVQRTTIIQYHNGGRYYSGGDMQKMTMTFDVYHHDLRSIRREYENRILSDEDHGTVGKLLRYGIYRIDNISVLDEGELKEYLASLHKIRSFYMFLFRDRKGQPIGTLGLYFNKENALNSTDIIAIKGKIIEIQNLLLSE